MGGEDTHHGIKFKRQYEQRFLTKKVQFSLIYHFQHLITISYIIANTSYPYDNRRLTFSTNEAIPRVFIDGAVNEVDNVLVANSGTKTASIPVASAPNAQVP